jgi:F-type H+-transporting ATPase subunit epsilon
MQLSLTIVSPEETLFDGEVMSVQVPGVLGRFEILENHAPIISSLTSGDIVYKTKSESSSLE